MKKSACQPLSEVTFHCAACYRTFTAAPRVKPFPERDYHPFRYLADCPSCDAQVEQVAWEQALLKAWAAATGPRTVEGKAASAANLDGHPTPEEALRTRFNAMKHGLRARTATYFPAKPDGYAFCSGCDVDRVWCSQQPACTKQTELFMRHQAAFEQRDPKRLMGIYSDLHAAVIAVLQQILQTIIADGVKLETPEYFTDKDGEVIFVEYVDPTGDRRQLMNVEAHPLFRPLGELISRVNISLADLGMTVKVVEADEEHLGQLAHEGTSPESLSEFRQRQTAALEGLAKLVERAGKKTEADPILIEYHQEQGGGGG